jgi:hypothetical protein
VLGRLFASKPGRMPHHVGPYSAKICPQGFKHSLLLSGSLPLDEVFALYGASFGITLPLARIYDHPGGIEAHRPILKGHAPVREEIDITLRYIHLCLCS